MGRVNSAQQLLPGAAVVVAPLQPSHFPELPQSASENAAASSLEGLITRMRSGDREAAGLFIRDYGPLIRRRARGKLGRAMRRLFDSQEILSTVSRRLDGYVRAQRLHAESAEQLWTLVFQMVDAALIDKMRILGRLQKVEGEESEFAARLLQRLRDADRVGAEGFEIQIDAALRSLKSDVDREVFSLWLAGLQLRQIADQLGTNAGAVRQRWQAIRDHLRAQLEAGTL